MPKLNTPYLAARARCHGLTGMMRSDGILLELLDASLRLSTLRCSRKAISSHFNLSRQVQALNFQPWICTFRGAIEKLEE